MNLQIAIIIASNYPKNISFEVVKRSMYYQAYCYWHNNGKSIVLFETDPEFKSKSEAISKLVKLAEKCKDDQEKHLKSNQIKLILSAKYWEMISHEDREDILERYSRNSLTNSLLLDIWKFEIPLK